MLVEVKYDALLLPNYLTVSRRRALHASMGTGAGRADPRVLLGGRGPPPPPELCMSMRSLSKMVRLGGARTDSRLSSSCCSGSLSCSVQGPWYGGGSSPSDSEMVGGRSISCCRYG